jgi:hypothetical protein
LLLASLVGAAATSLAAQSPTRIAIIPSAGFGIAAKLVDDPAFILKPKAAGFGAIAIELGMSKTVSIAAGLSRTFSQTLDLSGTLILPATADMTMTQASGSLIFRPGGRRPNGSPTPLFIEVGGGINFYGFKNIIVGSTAIPANDWKSTRPFGMIGAGMNFPIGPRSSVQVFGRAQSITAYTSKGLDDFNAAPPATNFKGKMGIGFQLGIGLRVGR